MRMIVTGDKSHFRPSAWLLVLLVCSHPIAHCKGVNFSELAESSLSLLPTRTAECLPPKSMETIATNTTVNITLPEGESRQNGGAFLETAPDWMGVAFLPAGSPEVRTEFDRMVGYGVNLDKHYLIFADDTVRRLKNYHGQGVLIPSYAFPPPSTINMHTGAKGKDKQLRSLRGVRNALGDSPFGLYRREEHYPTDIDYFLGLEAGKAVLETNTAATPEDCVMYGFSPPHRVEGKKGPHEKGDLFLTKLVVKVNAHSCNGPQCTMFVVGGAICSYPGDQGSPIVCNGKLTYLTVPMKYGGCTGTGRIFKVANLYNDIMQFKDNKLY